MNIKTIDSYNETLLWRAIKYPSTEHCHIQNSDTGYKIDAVIVGLYEEKTFRIDYEMALDSDWSIRRLILNGMIGGRRLKKHLVSDGNGHWRDQHGPLPEFDACFDVDISFTPLTNTLPIRRLQLHEHEDKEIKVLYIDVAEQAIKAVYQRYTKLSGNRYRFETVPGDFEADIEVDVHGFVIDYPGLFRRVVNLDRDA
jgi:hypothetical protein